MNLISLKSPKYNFLILQMRRLRPRASNVQLSHLFLVSLTACFSTSLSSHGRRTLTAWAVPPMLTPGGLFGEQSLDSPVSLGHLLPVSSTRPDGEIPWQKEGQWNIKTSLPANHLELVPQTVVVGPLCLFSSALAKVTSRQLGHMFLLYPI